MDLREYLEKIERYAHELPQRVQEIALDKAGAALVRKMKDRIFNQGLDKFFKILAEGYSTTPMYVTKDQFVKRSTFRPQGKNESGKRKGDGSERKSMYLPHGYKELKEIQGLQASRVNLLYRGDLKRAFSSDVEGGILYIGFTSAKEAEKAAGLAAKYNTDIFHAADEELLEYYDRLVVEMRKVYRAFFTE